MKLSTMSKVAGQVARGAPAAIVLVAGIPVIAPMWCIAYVVAKLTDD